MSESTHYIVSQVRGHKYVIAFQDTYRGDAMLTALRWGRQRDIDLKPAEAIEIAEAVRRA